MDTYGKRRVLIHDYDPIELHIIGSADAIDMFGREYLDEFGYDIDVNLIISYDNCMRQLDQIRKELRKIVNKGDHSKHDDNSHLTYKH